MLKALFIVGQCIRILHTDPWEDFTYRILNVGNYSYRVEHAISHGYENREAPSISFKEQSEYQGVDCPGNKEDSDLYK